MLLERNLNKIKKKKESKNLPNKKKLLVENKNINNNNKNLKNKLKHQQSNIQQETNNLKNNYQGKIINFELFKSHQIYNEPFLQKHNISKSVRVKMVDWMIEVLSSFGCFSNTFFVSVQLMDSFL